MFICPHCNKDATNAELIDYGEDWDHNRWLYINTYECDNCGKNFFEVNTYEYLGSEIKGSIN